MLSIITGDGLAPESCHGDPRNGHQPLCLGKVVDSEVMDRGSGTVIQFKRLTKDALASAITQAAANRVRRESSGEREEGMYHNVCLFRVCELMCSCMVKLQELVTYSTIQYP